MSKQEINNETSQIAWHELQRFFASGLAIEVNPSIDLLEVAYQFSKDNKVQVEHWMSQELIAPVSDQQALKWYEKNQIVWAVVIKPWVLVQDKSNKKSG